MSRWLGIDPGEKRIGIARSDALGLVAQPLEILDSVEALIHLLRESRDDLAGGIVGLPRNMDGSYGPLARRSAELVRRLRGEVDLPLYLWDERLTTRQADRISRSVGADRRHGGRRRRLDDLAAAVLLQSFLDAGTPAVEDPPGLGD
ncbi:MAG: Holliday junction resolvase RuvX [Planctomycetes bacterium]|nr:Holliday junction resolvase RuvX [Planctomycetota bacterium]